MNASDIFSPDTPANQTLRKELAPTDWVNPTPQSKYNLVVIGAGPAGLIAAAGAAGLGAKVALIEKTAMGGDCLNVGCVPSKALIRSAHAAHAARTAGKFGVSTSEPVVDFSKVMNQMRELRARLAPVDSPDRYQNELGVDVFLGAGKFTDRQTIEVGGVSLKFKKALIATGARAVDLPIPGLKEAGVFTNETLFSLTELPKRLVVIGAGPIGCEMAQAFVRFGSAVTLIEAECRILPREDEAASTIVKQSMLADGVETICEWKTIKVEKIGEITHAHLEKDGKSRVIECDKVLVGVGRAPNVQGLGLENAEVDFDDRNGVTVDDTLRTTNPHVFAAGDVAMTLKFTHTADAAARIVIQNALFKGRKKLSRLVVPWCTYTQPEIAHVGTYEHEANIQNIPHDVYIQKLDHVDRAILDRADSGFVKVITAKGCDKILGATIVAENAGDLISTYTLAITNGIGLAGIANTIFPYPTQAEAIKKTGDAYSRTKLTPFVNSLFEKWLRWQRG